MGVFIELTDTVQCWKQIHNDYQSLASEIDAFRLVLNTQDNRQRPVYEILPENLRNIVENGRFATALYQFKNNLAPSFVPLRHASAINEIDKTRAFENIKKKGYHELSTAIHQIVNLQADTVKLHDEFCSLLDKISKVAGQGEWGKSEVELIVSNRILLLTKFEMVIINADKALIYFLELFRFTANQARK